MIQKRFDITGTIHGKLTVLRHEGTHYYPNGSPTSKWACICDCGNELIVLRKRLISGDIKDCGCVPQIKKVKKLKPRTLDPDLSACLTCGDEKLAKRSNSFCTECLRKYNKSQRSVLKQKIRDKEKYDNRPLGEPCIYCGGPNKIGRRKFCKTCIKDIPASERKSFWHQQRDYVQPKPSPERVRNYMYKYNYGLTLSEVENMIAKANNQCEICKSEVKLNVDHNHNTNEVRGMLCFNCNTGLGMFKDNIDFLKSAVDYLGGTNL